MDSGQWVHQIQDLGKQDISPEPFLGEASAQAEWGHKQKPIEVFLPTASYEAFKGPYSIYLFGRRGTGKTAMINMLAHEVRLGNTSDYSHAWVVDEEAAYNKLATSVRTSALSNLPFYELVHELAEKWVWVLTVSAMLAVIRDRYKEISSDRNLAAIASYLRDEEQIGADPGGFQLKTSALRRLITVLIEELGGADYRDAKLVSALFKIGKRLFTANFAEAKEALYYTLHESNDCSLVLVDSIEFYDVHDAIQRATTTSLIEAAKRIYESRPTQHISVKIALPSELYPHLSSLNKEKTEGKNIFILWRYRDLVQFFAKRYCQCLKERDYAVSCKDIDSYEVAQEFLYKHISQTVRTHGNIEFDTLSYIIEHTMKKPRQLMTIGNVILTLAKRRDIDFGKLSPELVVEGLHARLDILVDGCLDMYDHIWKDASRVAKRTLSQAPSYFDASTLDIMLKESSSLRGELDMSHEDAKRLFLECGIIGIARDRHNLPDPRKSLLESLFEYQIKDTLSITNRTQCVIHPMFYEELQIDEDLDVFVYPRPAEDEEKEALSKVGIMLA